MQARGIETELVLLHSLRTTFGASGIAQSSIQVAPNERWHIALINVSTTSTTQTRCTIYRGPIGSTQLDFTRTGNNDTSNTSIELMQGETLTVYWTGGTSGSSAQLDIEGTRYLRGKRAY